MIHRNESTDKQIESLFEKRTRKLSNRLDWYAIAQQLDGLMEKHDQAFKTIIELQRVCMLELMHEVYELRKNRK